MKIFITPKTAAEFRSLGVTDGREYLVHPNLLAIIVNRAWPTPFGITGLTGRVVDASVGWDAGTPGFVSPANEGRRHTKITIYRSLLGADGDTTLATLLGKAPRP